MLKKSVSLKQILKKINEFHVFKKYAPPFEVGKMFRGDILRNKKEKHPSCNIYYNSKRWKYNDFGCCSFNCWEYMQTKFNITFEEALRKVDEDFNLGIGYNSNILYPNTQYNYKNIIVPEEKKHQRQIIEIKSSKWSPQDIQYWKDNGWTGQMVQKAKITPISSFYLRDNDGDLIRFDRSNELCYSYEYYTDNDNIFQRKIYSPTRTFGKWYSNVNTETIQGWDLMPKTGNIGFITSSFKDEGPFARIYNKWCAIASNNEGSFISERVWFKIKPRYKQWVLMLNNDEAGISAMKKYSAKYKIPWIMNPLGSPKDPTAFVRSYDNVDVGLREFNYYLNRELNGINN